MTALSATFDHVTVPNSQSNFDTFVGPFTLWQIAVKIVLMSTALKPAQRMAT